MAGLLDVLQNPTPEQSNMLMGLAQGLLSANGSQGMSAGILGMNNAQDAMLKRQELAQKIQIGNIGLQQQQQEWAAIQPALAAYAARQAAAGAAPAASAPSQPAIPPTVGGALGSGTFGLSVGGQPAQSAPAAASSGASGASDPFDIGNVIQSKVVGMIGGQPASTAFWDRLKLPDAVKTNQYYGLDPATVQASMLRDMATKGQVNARQNSTLLQTNPDGSVTPLFTPPDTRSGAYITWNNGMPSAASVPGLAAIEGNLAAAKAAGEGSVLPYAGANATGQPMPVTNRTAAATQGQAVPSLAPPGVDPNTPTTPYQRAGSDVAAVQREIDGVNRSMAPAATKKMQLDILNGELAKAQAAQTAQPAQAAPGAIYAAPPLGTVSNADTSQQARATSMKDSYTRLQSTGSTANASLDALDKMMALGAKKNPILTAGVLGTNQSAVNTDAAEYEKQRANVIALMAQQLGASGTDAGRANISDSVPDFGKPKAAIADGLGTLKNQLSVLQLKRSLLAPVYESGDSNKYTTLENQFDQNISPNMIPLLTMPAGQQRAQVLSAARKDPAMAARLNWAIQNGLLK